MFSLSQTADYIQIGRGLRLSHKTGKKECHVIDFVESRMCVNGPVSLPTLLGLSLDEFQDRLVDGVASGKVLSDSSSYSQEGMSICKSIVSEDSQSRCQEGIQIPRPTKVVYLDDEGPFIATDAISGAPYVLRLSPLAWVGCGEDIFVLGCLTKGFIRIERCPGDSLS